MKTPPKSPRWNKGNARLTESQVKDIKAARRDSPETTSAAQVAAKYGVSRHTIFDIFWGRRWAHVRPGRESAE